MSNTTATIKGGRGAGSAPKTLKHSSTFDQHFSGHHVSAKGGRGGSGGMTDVAKENAQNASLMVLPEEHRIAPLSTADRINNVFKGIFSSGYKKAPNPVE